MWPAGSGPLSGFPLVSSLVNWRTARPGGHPGWAVTCAGMRPCRRPEPTGGGPLPRHAACRRRDVPPVHVPATGEVIPAAATGSLDGRTPGRRAPGRSGLVGRWGAAAARSPAPSTRRPERAARGRAAGTRDTPEAPSVGGREATRPAAGAPPPARPRRSVRFLGARDDVSDLLARRPFVIPSPLGGSEQRADRPSL